MNKGLVSVVIPAFNVGKYLQETLQSVYDQSYTNLEVIIVDDGSSDNTCDIALIFVRRDSRFRYIKQTNKGVSSSRNSGYNFSTGEYLAFLDADDVWLPDNLELKVNLLRDSKFGLVHSTGVLIDVNSEPINRSLTGMEGSLLDYMLQWKGTSVPGPSSILIKREVVEEVGLFDIRLSTSADHDFFLRVSKRYAIGCIKQATWKYRLHDSNMHKNIALMEKDILLVYKNAHDNKLFRSAWFERKCKSNMYLILAANWAGDGDSLYKGIYYVLKAVTEHPIAVFNIINRLYLKWNQD